LHVVNRVPQVAVYNNGRGVGLNNMKKRLELLAPDRYSIAGGINGQEYQSTLTIRL
jgi:hypothetical protein